MLLCDDFEGFAAAAKPSGQWTTTSSGDATITVDTTRAYSGTKSAHFHGTVGKSAAYMIAQGAPVFPVPGNTIFVRFMMYIERWSMGNPMHNRLVWIGSSAALRNADGTGYAMETYNGIGIERIASGHYRTTSQHLTDSVNVGKWLCWEMEIDNNGGPVPTGSGTARPHLFREGTDLTMAISGQTTGWNSVPFDLLQFSLFAYQTDTASADYWIDDIAMNTQRVGCPTK
jgi:hypothetical protein